MKKRKTGDKQQAWYETNVQGIYKFMPFPSALKEALKRCAQREIVRQ